MSTKNRSKEEMLNHNYWEYIFGITKAGFCVTLLNPFEGEAQRKLIFGELPDNIRKLNDFRNSLIVGFKDIVNDKELAAKKFEECMAARKTLAEFSESVLPYISLCSIPMEKLEEENLRRAVDNEELDGKEPDYVGIYNKCMKLIENIPNTSWESYAKCRLFGILPFAMTKAKFYDMLEAAIDTLTEGKTVAYADKFFRLQEINLNPKGYAGFGENFVNTVKDIDKIASLNAENLTDDGLMEAHDSMAETIDFFKSVIENVDELYKDIGLFALIFCQGYDFEAITANDPALRDDYYYVREIVEKGGFDEGDILEAENADKVKNEIIDYFSEVIDYARDIRSRIGELHSSFTGQYSDSLKRIMDFALFAETLYYGNAEDDFLTDKENAGELASKEYIDEKKKKFMEDVKSYSEGLSNADRKYAFRKLVSTLYVPMEKVEFADFFVDSLKSLDDKKRNVVLLKFEDILDNETASHSCSCGHHHDDPDHVCTCEEGGECSCGHDHDHHHHSHDCSCGHDHHDVEEF